MNKGLTIFHEAPLSVFDKVQNMTGGDYFLANVLETNPEYLQKARESVAKGRHTILDNGVFELDKAMDFENFAKWICEIEPEYYIVPDVLEDGKSTIESMKMWIENYLVKVPYKCKIIGVAQGRNFSDFITCYSYMSEHPVVNKIAIPFDFSWYCKGFATEHPNKLVNWAEGRKETLCTMIQDGLINPDKPHHLLGCSLSYEFGYYTNDECWNFIESIDTSNPVVAGLKGLEYIPGFGLNQKPSQKLFTMINESVSEDQWKKIEHNIKSFAEICKVE